jgi:hypothetical protein
MVDAMLAKQPEASRFKLDPENFSEEELQELIGGQGLFSQKYIVDLRRLFESDETKEVAASFIDDIQKSENIFIWVEGELKKEELTLVEGRAEKLQEFKLSQKAQKKKEDTNLFPLGDALGKKDKKNMWLLYIDALANADINQIHGILFWQVKNMLLALKTATPEEAGISPFPYKKAKQYAGNFSEDELQTMSADLVALAHDARRGKHNFEIAVERWVLAL